MYVYCVYPAISKGPKQLPNCLKIAEASVILIVFIGVICDVSAILLPFFSVSLRLNNTEVYLTSFISTQNHKLEDKCLKTNLFSY